MCLILSSQFERTIITHCLILPLNILHQSGRPCPWAARGRQQACMVWEQSCRGAGMDATSSGTAPGRSGVGPGGALVLSWDPHLIEVLAAMKSSLRKVKENSRPQCCWFPKNTQRCALKIVLWCGQPTFLPKIYPAVLCCAMPSTHCGEEWH